MNNLQVQRTSNNELAARYATSRKQSTTDRKTQRLNDNKSKLGQSQQGTKKSLGFVNPPEVSIKPPLRLQSDFSDNQGDLLASDGLESMNNKTIRIVENEVVK